MDPSVKGAAFAFADPRPGVPIHGAGLSGVALRGLDQGVKGVQGAAARRADEERHRQTVRPVDDEHRRQRLLGPQFAQLAGAGGRIGERATPNDGRQPAGRQRGETPRDHVTPGTIAAALGSFCQVLKNPHPRQGGRTDPLLVSLRAKLI